MNPYFRGMELGTCFPLKGTYMGFVFHRDVVLACGFCVSSHGKPKTTSSYSFKASDRVTCTESDR